MRAYVFKLARSPHKTASMLPSVGMEGTVNPSRYVATPIIFLVPSTTTNQLGSQRTNVTSSSRLGGRASESRLIRKICGFLLA
jgi:hypothetical protein